MHLFHLTVPELWHFTIIKQSNSGGSYTSHYRTEKTPLLINSTGSGHPEYIVYALAPVISIIGLFGVLICHLLKKKGYYFTTETEQDMEEKKLKKIELNDSINEDSDTLRQIVHYIKKNKANTVLNEVVANNSPCDPESL